MKKITSQAYILKYPRQLIDSFSPVEYVIFDRMLYSVARWGNGILFNQTYLGEEKGIARETINRFIAKLKKLGLVITKQRRKGCAYIFLTNFFTRPSVRSAIAHLFSLYPLFISVNLLLSAQVTSSEDNKINTLKTRLDILKSGLTVCKPTRVFKKRMTVDMVSHEKLEKIADIEAALVKRGEKFGEFDISKLFAFNEECLDDAINAMKHAKPREPFGFFLSKCFAYCRWNNIEPYFEEADACRSINVLEKYKASQPAKQTIREQLVNKKNEQQKPYSEQVRQDMQREKLAAEARTRRFTPVQLVDEIAGMKRHVEELTARVAKGERGMSVALMIAQDVLARREHELLNSTESKDMAKSYTNTAPPSPIVRPNPNLFSYEEGEESEEDIPD